MRPLDEFVIVARKLRGRGGLPLDAAVVKLAAIERLPTVALPRVITNLLCIPEGQPDPYGDLDPYELVAHVRRTDVGLRSFRQAKSLLTDDLDDLQAPLDVAENRADNVQTAISMAIKGEGSSEEMVEDLAQMMENMAARLMGADPELVDDSIIQSVRSDLASIEAEIDEMFRWLMHATPDEMADAVATTVHLDDFMRSAGLERTDQTETERWRGVGRLAARVGVNPQQVVVGLDLLSALRDGGHLALPPPRASNEPNGSSD